MKSSASCASCAKPGDRCPAATLSRAVLAPKDVRRRVKGIAPRVRVPKAIDQTAIGRPGIGPRVRAPTAIGRWGSVVVEKVVVEKVAVEKAEAVRGSAAEPLAAQALDQEDRDRAAPAALVGVDSAPADRVKADRVKAGREKVLPAKVDPTVRIGQAAPGPMRARMLSQKPNPRFPRRGTLQAAATY